MNNQSKHIPTYNYDAASDTFSISFRPGELATGIELTDHILLRVNKQSQQVVGITLLDYSVLVEQTELGPRQFPLTGLSDISPENRDLVLHLLLQPPVQNILYLSAYTPSSNETIPIVSVQPLPIAADAT